MEEVTTKSINIPPYTYDKETGYFYNESGKQVGSYHNRKYGRTCYKGKHFTLSRLAFLLVEGWMPEEVDHKNGDTWDDRWENLRPSTRDQNAKNRRAYKTSQTGFKGVHPSRYKNSVYYIASIQVDNKRIYLGSFKTVEEASSAYNKAAAKYHGEFASLNKEKYIA